MPYLGKQPANVPVTADDIPDNSITSAKILDGVITIADIGANAVGNSEMADDAVGVTELSASGTASNTTFLRGDNAWAVVNTNLVADTSPQLGGNLDLNSNNITGTGGIPAANLTGSVAAARLTVATTQAESDNSTKLATTAYVTSKITTLIGGAPSTLNDLNELALAINDDSNYNSTLTTALATKLPLAGGAMTGAITTNSTFDGRDVAADGVTADAALPKAGGTMTGNIVMADDTSIGISDSAERIEFDGAGDINVLGAKLGINTTAPDEKLDVRGTVGVGYENGGMLRLYNQAHSNYSSLRNSKVTSDGSAANMWFSDSTGFVMAIESGKVGIGTFSPAEMLEIYNATSPAIQLNDGGDYKSIFRMAGNDLEIRGSSGSMEFYNGSADGDSSAQRMTINSSGNVGIGTSAPDTEFHVVGAGTVAKFEATDGPAYINIKDDDGTQGFLGLDAGSFVFQTSGSSYSNKLVINSAGNVGIGVTPEAWHANWTALQLGATGFVGQYQSGGTDLTALGSNVYSDGTYRYIETDEAAIYKLQNGIHIFDVAASGSADAAISWNTAMTIANNGEITTLGGIASSVAGGYYMLQAAQGNNTYPTYSFQNDGNTGMLRSAADTLGFVTGGSERMRITSAGNVGIGVAAPDSNLHVHGTGTLLSSDSYFVAQIQTDRNDNGSSDDAILQFVNGSAKTVKGEIRWDESSNTFELGHGDNANHIVIDSTGAVTMPAQPAFHVNATTLSSFSASTNSKVDFDTERFDVNSDYNVSTQTFTAPVTGKYQLNAQVLWVNWDSSADYYYLQIITSNRTYYDLRSGEASPSDPQYTYSYVHAIADMDAGDTAYVNVYQSGGATQTGYDNQSFFSGYLAC